VIRAVLDANVIISAPLIQVGISSQILDAAYAGVVRCLSSGVIVSEVLRTLTSHRVQRKYSVARSEIDRVREFLESRPVHVPITVTVQGVATHPEDDVILSTAVSARADHLVTGDRQLLALGEYQGVQIVSPRDFYTILGLSGRE
jgi:putative PIN family toxin of toxin-antitoxin system